MRSSDIPRINYYLCVQGMNKEGGKRSVEKSVQKEEEERKKKSPRPGLNELRIDKDGDAEVSAKKDAGRRGWERVA